MVDCELYVLVENYAALEAGPGPAARDGELRYWRPPYEPDLAEAYRWQLEILAEVDRRWPSTAAGFKISIVAEEDRGGVGATEPAFGRLRDVSFVPSGSSVALDRLNGPLIEPELQLRNHASLHSTMRNEELAAVMEVAGGIELPVSRVVGWRSADDDERITLGEFIADNAGSGVIVLGRTWIPATDVDLTDVSVELGLPDGTRLPGHSGRVMGNPLNALRWLLAKLEAMGEEYPAGLTVSSGALRPPTVATAGTFAATFGSGLGTIAVEFV